MPIKTRYPTGSLPWPLVLLEGPELSGKTYAAAEFTASERVGDCYWLPVGDTPPDEYAAIMGPDCLVVEHNGAWYDILSQVAQIHAVALDSDPGDPPTVLVIDSMTCEWELHKDWITARARSTKSAQKLLREDPNSEIKLSRALWDDAGGRHDDLMRLLKTFNGIVIVTARCKETVVDSDGRIIPGSEYRVDAHRGLTHDASVWVRLSRDERPTLIGCRVAGVGAVPGVDKSLQFDDFRLDGLLFDVLGYTPASARPRVVTPLVADETELAAQARAAVREYVTQHRLNEEQVLAAFYRQHGEALRECRDVAVILQFLKQLRQSRQEAS
ncbi:hypothetical protein A5784_34935 [Mycobacterium sp. 852013-50091_SCH5140682]|uniref:AAA family ATPase n=1 Tax=Mycobacterium sp. 852013-50091_SCH5140682 TaxID=1834109 RepID=UPI0007EB94E3|nr:AAA family ATPase [Mycobacterium sp. 852013-50091_SCH5140682]OBC11396.1 hypothetical protein A5784_34935 [Mycobacterium sp. 852013-50091_SCH5140682]